MSKALPALLAKESSKLKQAGLKKAEHVFASEDDARGKIDFTSSDYLGLAGDPDLQRAASEALERHGFGIARSRAFGGTRQFHKDLEAGIADFFGKPDAVVFASGYLANIGLFETLFDHRDLIFCDAWVSPSLLEGARLSSGRVVPYRNGDMEDLEAKLRRSRSARFRVVVTDGVFAFSGDVAPLVEICELAKRYEAVVVLDDSLGVGVLGDGRRGSAEHRGVLGQVDIITGGFAPVMGGGGGGYLVAGGEITDWLRQKSSPYLFAESLPPAAAAAASCAIDKVKRGNVPFGKLHANVATLRELLSEKGFQLTGEDHPLMTIAIGEAMPLQKLVNDLAKADIQVQGLCYPVVPERKARVRIQVAPWHDPDVLDDAVTSLAAAKRKLGIL